MTALNPAWMPIGSGTRLKCDCCDAIVRWSTYSSLFDKMTQQGPEIYNADWHNDFQKRLHLLANMEHDLEELP